jgi:hypothetical protein
VLAIDTLYPAGEAVRPDKGFDHDVTCLPFGYAL